jgi:formyltetrahydrofolate-dependent phosphoribosylglycinamide formyltransferase
MKKKRLAVLASGSGTNFDAIAAHLESEGIGAAAQLCLVASNRANAPVLDKARARNIPAALIVNPSSGEELGSLLRQYDIDLVALAGYLKLVPRSVIQAYAERILNVHPALLPRHGGPGMYGLRVHQAVLDSGDDVSGVSVHLVDEQYDHGAVLARCAVPVLESDTAETLAARVLEVEHIVYPRVISAFARGTVNATEPMTIAPESLARPQRKTQTSQ